MKERKPPNGPARSHGNSGTVPPTSMVLAAYRFPHGDAMSNRLLHLARSATPEGATVLVVNDWPAGAGRPDPSPDLPPGVRLITLTGGGGRRPGRWLHQRTRPLRALVALRRAGLRTDQFTAAYLPLGLWTLTTWAVLRVALRCPLTVDVVERHDPEQFPRGRLAPYFIRHRWSAFLAGRTADRVIAISETIERQFLRRGRRTMVVPPQVDCADYGDPAPPSLHDGLRLLYAGSAGPKDLLAVVLAGIRLLPPADRARIRLVIAGMSREQATDVSDLDEGDLAALGEQVTILGRIPRRQVLAELSRAHFSVLVRPTAGYAQAGFPSKVPESLAAGCPVLLNHTSDLARHIVDGREGIVLAGHGAEDVREGLVRALALSDAQWWRMSRHARERARSFDYRSWRLAVSRFVTDAGRATGAGNSTSAASSSSSRR
ncbi:glycosyltransferase [Micromonospora sp. NPDC047074]|uniref:glycosyltransferase n=1 Tax=Micromonospora sp. NPDC047074 TaxID=3154339 RepID=UPI00340AB237